MARYLVRYEKEVEANDHTDAVMLFLTNIYDAMRDHAQRKELIKGVRYKKIDGDGKKFVGLRA